MNRRRGFLFFGTISIAFIGLLIVCIVPIKKNINTTLNGVEFQIQSDEYKTTTIKIDGQYIKFLLRPDSFKGKIQIEGYDFTFEDYYYIDTSFKNGYGHLNYTGIINGSIYGEFFGFIYTKDFEKILIYVDDKKVNNSKDWDGKYNNFICAPATSIEEAKKIFLSISEEIFLLNDTR